MSVNSLQRVVHSVTWLRVITESSYHQSISPPSTGYENIVNFGQFQHRYNAMERVRAFSHQRSVRTLVFFFLYRWSSQLGNFILLDTSTSTAQTDEQFSTANIVPYAHYIFFFYLSENYLLIFHLFMR